MAIHRAALKHLHKIELQVSDFFGSRIFWINLVKHSSTKLITGKNTFIYTSMSAFSQLAKQVQVNRLSWLIVQSSPSHQESWFKTQY